MSLSVSMRQLTIYFVCSGSLPYGTLLDMRIVIFPRMYEEMLWGWCCLLLQFQLLSYYYITCMSPQLHTEGGASDMLLAFNKNMKEQKFLFFC